MRSNHNFFACCVQQLFYAINIFIVEQWLIFFFWAANKRKFFEIAFQSLN
jgi:hypothetical protein